MLKEIKYRVNIIESERYWGSKVDETLLFDSEDEATDYVVEYNEKHCSATKVPDWYMRAEYVGPEIQEGK